MKKLWVALMIVMLGMTGGITNVEAKRLGGGGSFGKSSPSPAKPAPMQNAGQQAPRPAAPGRSCRWINRGRFHHQAGHENARNRSGHHPGNPLPCANSWSLDPAAGQPESNDGFATQRH